MWKIAKRGGSDFWGAEIYLRSAKAAFRPVFWSVCYEQLQVLAGGGDTAFPKLRNIHAYTSESALFATMTKQSLELKTLSLRKTLKFKSSTGGGTMGVKRSNDTVGLF